MSNAFTGERLVPGEVDAGLWNEHISRYAFAASLCHGTERVLDAGCGTGYGTRYLSQTARSVVGVDASADAIAYATNHYRTENAAFLVGLCEDLPSPAACADLIVAFEVIEHLAGWRQFLNECSRVLAPGGRLLVSTPNKRGYTESRGGAGPNPFHVHEFEFAEFAEELGRIFPHVRVFGQNHAESIVFSALATSAVSACLASLHADPAQAGFFLAVCAREEIDAPANFVYVPESANLLRERERHIELLRGELGLKDASLLEAQREHAALVQTHRELETELNHSNAWADALNRRLDAGGARVLQLQEELTTAETWAKSLDRDLHAEMLRVVSLQEENAREQVRARQAIDRLEEELESRTAWAHERDAELTRCAALLEIAERTVIERSQWALDLQAQADSKAEETLRAAERLARCSHALEAYRQSRWVRFGKRIGLGPSLR